MGSLNVTVRILDEWWKLYNAGEIVYLSDMIKEIGMGATHSEEPVEGVQEETMESKEEEMGMFSKEARKVLGWEHGLGRFYELLMRCGSIHSKKNRDYTSIHPLENFFRVAMTVGISPEDVVEVFVATKSARIKSLHEQGAEPENESLLDSYIDRAVYSLLGAAIHEMSGEEQAKLCEHIATEDLFVEEGEDEAE